MTAFEEFGVIPELGKAVDDMEWLLPTDVQAEAIPMILGGGDVLMAAGKKTHHIHENSMLRTSSSLQRLEAEKPEPFACRFSRSSTKHYAIFAMGRRRRLFQMDRQQR